MRSQRPVKLRWDWRDRGTAKNPRCLCAGLCKSVTLAEILCNKISVSLGKVVNGPTADEITLTLWLYPSFTFCKLSHSRAVPCFPGKGHKRQTCSHCSFTSQHGRAVPSPLGILQHHLPVPRGIQSHRENFADWFPALQWTDICVGYDAPSCSSSSLVRTGIISVASFEERTCVYMCTQTARKKAICDTVIQTVQCESRKLDHGVRKQSPCCVWSNGECRLRKEGKWVMSLLFPGTEFLMKKQRWEHTKWS